MRNRIYQISCILLLSIFSMGVSAQINRTTKTKVADVLAQMPAKNLTVLDKAMNEVYEMGDEGFAMLTKQLTPAGVGDDTAVRFVLNGFARYASQFGKPEVMAYAEKNFLKALEAQSDVEVKTFLMNQLNLVGGHSTVEALTKYITSSDLAEPAIQTLLMIGCPRSVDALIEAFPTADENVQQTIARALGELRSEEAVKLISPMATSSKESMRKTALAALAEIAAPESYKTMLKAASEVDFAYESTNATEAFIDYTDRLGENGELELMEKAYKAIVKANSAVDKLHNSAAALYIYAKYKGYEATPALLEAVDSNDKAFRYTVLNIAEKIGGVADTRKWLAKAVEVETEVKADIISMLGRRGCQLASPYVLSSMESSSSVVREEAVVAYAQLEGTNAISALANHMAKGNDIEITLATLKQLLDKEHLYLVAGKLESTSGETKAAFIDCIASKSGSQYFDAIFGIVSSTNATEKIAAYAALKSVSAYENTDPLLGLLERVSEDEEIEAVQQAVIAAIRGVEQEQTEEGKVLSALETASHKERILPILPAVGGPVALETVGDYFNKSNGELKDAAFRALTQWEGYAASATLYDICKNTEGEYRTKAVSSFTRMVNSAKLPADQKLLQYRKIMEYADEDQANSIVRAVGRLNTFLSLIYLEGFLDNKGLQQSAALGVKDIAIKGKYYGTIVRRALEKASSVMEGGDSQYYKIDIANYLSNMPKEEGFVSMFNGNNLDGWQGMIAGGNPIKIKAMSDKERANAQEEANKKMLENWSVKDGKIVFSGHGANLVSTKEYKDFEMIVDWLITKKGDSGIYLRGTPQVQIWDTSRVEVGAQVGSGGLYNNNKDNVRNPLKVADNPVDEWNTFRITMIGENVTIYLNGELVVDNVRMDNYWNREIPIFESGTIELQAHGNELAFRDIYVREIDTDNIGLTEEEKTDGFVSLFNGKNLDGWQGNKVDYYAENGELVVDPKKGGHGNLFTGKEYSDFIFRFEFQLTPGANNGLGIRAPLKGDAAYVGTELQILDNTAPVYANLEDYQYHGSAYGIIPAKRGFLKPVGEWNVQEVYLNGSQIKITLNGEVILDGDLKEASKNGTLDKKDHPGLKRDSGYIGFLGHGSELKFRNLRIKDLSK